jgi:hypothetical protein
MIRKEWTDEDGFHRAVLLPDGCPEDRTDLGIPSEPPDVSGLDWVAIRRELHNGLIDAGILTWVDVQQRQTAITSICRRVLIRRVIQLYRLEGGPANE